MKSLEDLVDGAIDRLLAKLAGNQDRDWVIRELVAEVAYRDQELKELELKRKRLAVACGYLSRRGRVSEAVLKESRRIATTMRPQDVEDRYESLMEIVQREKQKRKQES